MDHSERSALIASYKEGYQEVYTALQQLTEEALDRRPADGGWTPREIVHHLADSEMTSAIRLRLLLASEHPAIAAYDEKEFARKLHYDRPIEASLEALKAARRTSAEILDRMSEADWAREGMHSESGRYTTGTWLEIYSVHAHNHAAQIRRARASATSR